MTTNVLEERRIEGASGRRYIFALREYLDGGIYLQCTALNKQNSTVGGLHIPDEDMEVALPAFIETLRSFQDW